MARDDSKINVHNILYLCMYYFITLRNAIMLYLHIMECHIDAFLRTLRLLSYENSPYPPKKHSRFYTAFPAHCYAVGTVQCNTVPPCRIHVHMFTTIYSFWGQGQTFMQFLRANNMFTVWPIGINGLESSYRKTTNYYLSCRRFDWMLQSSSRRE